MYFVKKWEKIWLMFLIPLTQESYRIDIYDESKTYWKRGKKVTKRYERYKNNDAPFNIVLFKDGL